MLNFHSVLVLKSLFTRQRSLHEFQGKNTMTSFQITYPHYFRLVAFSLFDALGSLPLGILNIIVVVSVLHDDPGGKIWPSWNVVHAGDNSVLTATSTNWRSHTLTAVTEIYQNCIFFIFAFISFPLLGLTNEMLENYRYLCTKAL